MTQKTNFFKLGLFVIIAFGLGAAFLIIFGAGDFFKKELLVETCFNESVQGLTIGSEVKYKGIQIGSVKAITSVARVYQIKSDYVLVIIALEDSVSLGQIGKTAGIRVQNAIRDGLNVRLAFKGLTGVAYLETDYSEQGLQNPPQISWSPKNTYIPSQKSNMRQLGDALNQILENLTALNLQGITVDMDTLLRTLDQKVSALDMEQISGLAISVLTELKETSHKANAAMGSARVKKSMEDAQAAFAGLRELIETSKGPLSLAINDFQKAAGSTKNMTAEFETRLAPRVNRLSSNLDHLVESLAATSQVLENMVWLNSDKVQLIMENLEATTENLKQMSKDIKQYPGRLLFERPPEKIPPGKSK